MGREVLCWDVDDNFVGDTVVMLEVLIDTAGDEKTSSGRSFRGFWLRITQLYPGGEITFE